MCLNDTHGNGRFQIETRFMKNCELISFASADELASVAANAWLDEIESANRAGKTHCVALSGGRITQKFFTATVELAQARKISFERVHFFWADERCVPPTDPESNFKLASELLFAPLKIPAKQIHRIRGEDSASSRRRICRRRITPRCFGGQKRPAGAGFDFSRHG